MKAKNMDMCSVYTRARGAIHKRWGSATHNSEVVSSTSEKNKTTSEVNETTSFVKKTDERMLRLIEHSPLPPSPLQKAPAQASEVLNSR